MALFLPRGHQRPSALTGRIVGHAQARNLVHWWPVLSNQVFTSAAANPSAVSDVLRGRDAANAWDVVPLTSSSLPGKLLYSDASADAQTGLMFTPDAAKFKGVSAGGAGATFNVWVKLNLATPVTNQLTGAWTIQAPSIVPYPDTHYPWTDGTMYAATLRHDRLNFPLLSVVDRSEWHMVTVTHTGVTWRCYQNAQIVHTDATGDGHVYVEGCSGGKGSIHGSSLGGYTLNGYSCDYRLYNRALTLGEIQALYDPVTRWSLYYGV